MSKAFLSQFATANTRKDEGVACLYDPDEDGCELILMIKPVKPREITKMSDDARGRGAKVNTGKFNEALVERCLKGWRNMTVDQAVVCGLFDFEPEDLAQAKEVWPDEIPFDKATAVNFMNESTDFAARINELASEVETLRRAKAAYEGKASGTGPATGD